MDYTIEDLSKTTCYDKRLTCYFKGMNEDGSAENKELVNSNVRFSPCLVKAPDEEWISINVGGVIFQTRKCTLMNFPGTLLADINENSPYFHNASGQFRFDRSSELFKYILDFYRYGDLHFPHSICGPQMKREINFWGIKETFIAPCCWKDYKLYAEQEETLVRLGAAFNVIDKFDKTDPGRCMSHCHKMRKHIWNFLEDPTSSPLAQIWAIIYMFMILVSVLTLALDTHKAFRIEKKYSNLTSCQLEMNPKYCIKANTEAHPLLIFIECVITSLFAMDIILRFIVCPNKVNFLKKFLNWVDFMVVNSQIATFILLEMPAYKHSAFLQTSYEIFTILKIARVLLILKLARHYTGLRILILALKASLSEMVLLVVFMVAGMMIFSTLIYYAELSVADQFPDIPTGFWWAIITMTTVGYGDVSPKSYWGFAVGAGCAMCGMLLTGLPIPIIANNFTQLYEVQKMKVRMDERDASSSSEMLDSVKSMFRTGGTIVVKMKDKIGDGITQQLDNYHFNK